jgi:hypothetical protein
MFRLIIQLEYLIGFISEDMYRKLGSCSEFNLVRGGTTARKVDDSNCCAWNISAM